MLWLVNHFKFYWKRIDTELQNFKLAYLVVYSDNLINVRGVTVWYQKLDKGHSVPYLCSCARSSAL